MDNLTTTKNVNKDEFTVILKDFELNMKEELKELEYIKQHTEEYHHFTNWSDLEKSLLSDIKDEDNI